jgi:CBS domain-containing protein
MTKDNPTRHPELVRELMTVGVLTCSQDTQVRQIAEALLEKDVEAVVVLDDEGHGIGIVGRDQLVRAYAFGSYDSLTALEIMEDGIPQVPPEIPIGVAAQLMQDQGRRIFFLMHNAGGIIYPAAYISYKHFLRHIQSENGEELKDLGIDAARTSPLEAFRERRDANKKKAGNTQVE